MLDHMIICFVYSQREDSISILCKGTFTKPILNPCTKTLEPIEVSSDSGNIPSRIKLGATHVSKYPDWFSQICITKTVVALMDRALDL